MKRPSFPNDHFLEQTIVRHCLSVIANENAILPLTDKTARYFFLTSGSHGKTLVASMASQGFVSVISPRREELENEDITAIIDTCDVFLLETVSAKDERSLVEANDRASCSFDEACQHDPDIAFLWYAASQGKTCIHLMRDTTCNWSNSTDLAGASVAVHKPAGYENDASEKCLMAALADVLTAEPTPSESNTGMLLLRPMMAGTINFKLCRKPSLLTPSEVLYSSYNQSRHPKAG